MQITSGNSASQKKVAFRSFILSLSYFGIVFSTSTGAGRLEDALNNLCCDLQALVPVTAMLLVITAGVIYSIGQMFGSETRARANVWATSCLTGAVIGVLIAQIAPHVLSMIAGATIVCSCT